MRPQSQILHTLRAPSAQARLAPIVAHGVGKSRAALGREVCAQFGFVDARGTAQLTGCLKALAVLETEGQIALPAPRPHKHRPSPRRLDAARGFRTARLCACLWGRGQLRRSKLVSAWARLRGPSRALRSNNRRSSAPAGSVPGRSPRVARRWRRSGRSARVRLARSRRLRLHDQRLDQPSSLNEHAGTRWALRPGGGSAIRWRPADAPTRESALGCVKGGQTRTGRGDGPPLA